LFPIFAPSTLQKTGAFLNFVACPKNPKIILRHRRAHPSNSSGATYKRSVPPTSSFRTAGAPLEIAIACSSMQLFAFRIDHKSCAERAGSETENPAGHTRSHPTRFVLADLDQPLQTHPVESRALSLFTGMQYGGIGFTGVTDKRQSTSVQRYFKPNPDPTPRETFEAESTGPIKINAART